MAVKKELETFENAAKWLDKEHALVITEEGKVYECFGTEIGVFPDFDLNEELSGAIVSHNHSKDYTLYSISSEDLSVFLKYSLASLRGVDYRYKYELDWSGIVDKAPLDWANEYNYRHSQFIYTIEPYEFSIGYHRSEDDRRRI